MMLPIKSGPLRLGDEGRAHRITRMRKIIWSDSDGIDDGGSGIITDGGTTFIHGGGSGGIEPYTDDILPSKDD